ncbi:MAG: pilus assembly protein N-terminal domain-containing protein, partial [Alphaproteobacteria bacterium]
MTSSIRSWWTLARQHAVGFAVAVVLSAVAVALPVTESHGQATSLTPASEAIMLEAGKGMLLRLEGAAASVFVADAKIADIDVKSSRLIYLFGVTPGETTLYAVGADDSVLASVEVQVSHNIARLQSAIRNLAPNSTVDARSLNGSVILSGMALSAAEAEEIRRMTVQLVTSPDQIINQMRVASPNQINLRVKVAEVSREVTKNLGFSLDAVGTPGGSVIGLVTGLFTPGPGGILGGRPSVFETFSGGAAFGNISPGSFDINGLIDALEEEGLISVLAEPNLTAL